MDIHTVKDVDQTTWAEFKRIAARNKMTLGKTFKTMLQSYQKQEETVWQVILKGDRILSDAEALSIEKTVKKIRSEGGFR